MSSWPFRASPDPTRDPGSLNLSIPTSLCIGSSSIPAGSTSVHCTFHIVNHHLVASLSLGRHSPRLSGERRWDRLNWPRAAKRIFDAAVSGFALLALSPLFALVAMAILVTTGRPIFYTQERVGQGGRRFRIIKFRSMRRDAENVTGPIWASDHDARCTRIGDWLRHTNIDELPQLFNVLRGDMSLVGPRPERPNFVENFRQTIPDYDLRHAVPGGMTGWAQVHGWRRPNVTAQADPV